MRKASHHRSLLTTTLVCTLLTLAIYVSPLHTKLEHVAEDWMWARGRKAPADPRLVFLAIDADSLTLDGARPIEIETSQALRFMQQGFPYSRELYPLILDRLVGAGARLVIFDMLFPTPREGDAAFRGALDRYRGQVALGFTFPQKEAEAGNQSSVQMPASSLIPEPKNDPRIGFVTYWTDGDEVVRRLWFRRKPMEVENLPPVAGETAFLSLAAAAAQQSGHGDLIPPGTNPRIIRYADWGEEAGGPFRPRSLYEIFVPSFWERNYGNGEFFRDKIVVIGPSGNWSKDFARTPFGQIEGPLFHLNALNALLTGQYLRELPLGPNCLLILLGGGIACILGFWVRNSKLRALLFFVVMVVWLGLDLLIYRAGTIMIVVAPLFSLASSGGSFFFAEFLTEQKERQRIRRTLEGCVSKDVVREVLDNPQSYLNTAEGERRAMSILFSDVRGFTSLAEGSDAAALVKQLNEYFTAMVRVVFAHDGTLDKFIGDAVMAHWGGVDNHPSERNACHAVSTALQMLQELTRLNADWKQRGFTELRIGIGINFGEAICGRIGAEEKFEFSAIGDAVNVASRLEGATKIFHAELLLGESVAPFVRDRFVLRTVGLLQLKGKAAPAEVFTALGERTEVGEIPWLAQYEEGVARYRGRDFAAAIERFEAAAQQQPEDWLIAQYLRISRECLAAPPGPEWNAVWVLTEK